MARAISRLASGPRAVLSSSKIALVIPTPEQHLALLARHLGVEIACITERPQNAVQRAYVVLDFRHPVPKALGFVRGAFWPFVLMADLLAWSVQGGDKSPQVDPAEFQTDPLPFAHGYAGFLATIM